jgi:acetyltransferase-like isoleucine patch superfamily enzyme
MNILRLTRSKARKLKARLTPLRFANKPVDLKIKSPIVIQGARRISIGEQVFIGENSVIRAVEVARNVRRDPNRSDVCERFEPRILIGSRVWATSALHLDAHREVTIEDDVMLASNVFISDASHGYADANVPYMYQPRSKPLPIRIGRGCWIGQNVAIMPGVTVGELSIIGANSVVTKNVPPQCIAAGSPARVIKRWDARAECWVPVEREAGAPLEESWKPA